jgi:two-component system, OmpR family, sensor histidine kinase KdpD
LPKEAEAELLATIEEASDRLTNLVENLLSLSRLHAGALSVQLVAVAVDGAVAQAVLNTGSLPVQVRLPVRRVRPCE